MPGVATRPGLCWGLMPATVSSLLAEVPDLPEHEAVRLLLAAARTDRSWVLGNPEVSAGVADRFFAGVRRRRGGEPLQYIEGGTQFGPIELSVDSRALIPRPETERLFELCLELTAGIDAPVVVDLCTGTGNVALAVKHSVPEAAVYATDVSPDAIALASQNGEDLGLDVRFATGDLFAPLPASLRGGVDLVVANPPYVSEDEYQALPPEIALHEPRAALVAGNDGLDILRRIAADASDWLRPGGVIACEIGETQGNACVGVFSLFGARIELDLAGRERFVVGCAPMLRDVH